MAKTSRRKFYKVLEKSYLAEPMAENLCVGVRFYNEIARVDYIPATLFKRSFHEGRFPSEFPFLI